MYRVLYSSLARDQVAAQVTYLRSAGAPDETIETWFAALFDRIDDLAAFPLRHPVADEYAGVTRRSVRRLVFGDYLVFYHVDEAAGVVEVIAFRHGSRLGPKKEP